MASSMLTAEVSASGSTEAEVDKALKASLLSCANDPDFAVICDFLQKFSKDLGLDLPNFKLLLQWLTKTDEVSPQLREMQIKLLRKTRKTVHEKSWESALSKFCFTYSAQDGWEIERFGYKNSSVKVKLRILRELLECQFERNTKFRSKILTLSADSLRSKPIGRDRQGHAYWVTQDNDCNIRIYQEHLDEEIWHVVATNRDEFVNLLKRLKGSEVVEPCEDIDIVDEDTTSSGISHIESSYVQKDLTPEEKVDSQEDEQKIPKLSIKLAFGRNSKETTNAEYLGKGEEELAAEEDAKLLKKSCSKTATGCEEEFEEIEEEFGEESGSEDESDDEVIDSETNLKSVEAEQKSQKNFKSKDTGKKVEPLLISQNKILNSEISLTSNNGGKKRSLDGRRSVSSPKSEKQGELKKFRPSLLHSKRSKFSDKKEDSKKMNELSESSEENDEDQEEEEVEEEDIDSVAAEEDENEEKLFEEYENENEEEPGEEITDPVVKVVGEGSGKDCNVENMFYYIDYDSDNFVVPTLDDVIIEDVRYVYGAGSGEACLVGNIAAEKEEVNVEKSSNESIKSAEIKPEPQPGTETPEKENKDLEQTDNLITTIKPEPNEDEDDKKDAKKCVEEVENGKKSIDINTEKPENSNENLKQINSQEINDANVENLTKDTLTENRLIKNEIHDNAALSDIQTRVDEKTEETSCNKDNQTSSEVITKSDVKPTPCIVSTEQTHANKMSALESLKKELRESKQKLLEKKLPQPTENKNVKICNTSIYNRKRRFTDQTQTISARPTNSESEIDLNSENNEDITNEKEIELGESEEDVGGKRLKMRPKQTSSELRKKIEAQKFATKEETTSSSGGEEGPKKQRKLVFPKKPSTSENIKLEKMVQNPKLIEDVSEKNDVVEDVKSERAASNKKVAATKPARLKPSLAEIIEKKLKKTPDKKQNDATSTDKDTNKEVSTPKYSFPSLNKSPITKPLKKNVLIQIRQEANDEVPRKRCNSQDVNQTALNNTTSICPTTKNGSKEDFEKQKNTLEKQRKRRSSEEALQNDTPEEPEAKKEVTVIEETVTLKCDRPHVVIKEDVMKEELFLQTETTLPVTGRRSGRRGGVIPNYVEVSLSKRNRGAAKKSKECTKNEETPEKFQVNVINPKSDDNKGNVINTRSESSAIPSNKTIDAKEAKTENNANLVEKKTMSDNLKSISTPKTATKGGRKQREVDTTNIIDVDSETPVRQSRRIAQQKIREEAERRKLEEIALRTMKQELKKKKKAEKQADPTIAPPTEPSSESEENDVEIKRKIQKKKLPGKNGNWSSGSEEQEEPEEEDEEPHHYETDPGSPLFKSDHEFSPESDIEDESQVVPMKRARTVRKEDADVDGIAINKEEEACQKCNKSDHPEWILLCDNCDKGYHCSCLSPVLFYIPEGNWYCPPCQQEQLIKSLEDQLKEFDDLVEKKKKMEEDEKRIAEEEKARQEEEEEKSKCKPKKDIKMHAKKYSNNSSSEDNSQEEDDDEESITNSDDSKKSGPKNQSKQRYHSRNLKKSDKRHHRDRRINSRNRRNRCINRESDSESDSLKYSRKSNSVSNGNSSSSSTYSESDNEPIYKLRKRRQINVSYRLNEYDDLINSALKKEMEEVAGAGNLGRGKDISTIIEADKEEKARQKQMHDGEVVASQKEDNYEQEKQQDLSNTKINDANKTKIKDEIKKEESDSDAEPIIRKLNVKPSQRKKSRKLTTLDISSEDDDGSDEDFKGSSIEDDEEEEDTSISDSNSDSSLEIYKKFGKFKKKRRKAARRAFRERRRDRRFLFDESDDEDIKRPKSKKKRKDESDYTESEADEDDISDLSENIDSADLCDDTTTEESDGAWKPNRKKKAKKSTNATEAKCPKLKNSCTKKPKRVEYSDDDVSDSEEDEDEEVGGSGKGYGKQPRSQPLKKPSTNSTKTKGKGKEKPDAKARNKKSSDDESSQSNSEDSTRKTRGRRYAYIEDFDDDSSDGGIKPGVQRPDTPPEEREKFIKRQEEIKRMLAEKNAEGAILAATPRLTPIKTDSEKDKKSPAKAGGDSLSTVPLSVIRQAKVLDIDYLQRRGENLDDLSNEVGEVDDDFDDADLPDDLPEDMDEDAIARMVEEEEEFGVTAARELPAPDDVLRTSNLAKQIKTKEGEKPTTTENSSTFSQTTEKIAPANLPAPSPNLQEPIRKRLPMPTIHPPLLRHQYLMHESMNNTQHMMQRQSGPSSHLLQNALSAPLSQPLDRTYPTASTSSPHHSINRIAHSIPLQSTVSHALNATRPSHPPSPLANTKPSVPLNRTPQDKTTNPQIIAENKPRGRRKKITPLRDTLQKQQTAAAVTAATATSSALCSSLLKNNEPSLSSVIKSGSTQKLQVQPHVMSNMHPTSHSPVCRPPAPLPPIAAPFVGSDGSRFYDALGSRTPQSSIQRHRGPPQMPASLLPPPPTNRSSYGPPPPLKGSNSGPSPVSSSLNASAPIRNPMQHIPPQYLGMPPNARHASHLNMFRPPIYGNPNFGPRSSLRPPNILAQEFTSGSRSYPPYGFYPPPPPLTTPGQRPGPLSTSRTSTQIPPVQSNITHPSTSVIVSSKSSNSPSVAVKHASAHIPEITDSNTSSKSVVVKKEFSVKSSPPKSSSPTLVTIQTEKTDAIALSPIMPRKKLTTLQAYTSDTSKKSPVLPVSDSSVSRSPPNPPIGVNDESATIEILEATTTTEQSADKEDKASEFSGLVSYFSSQHDDYNT